MKNFFFVFILFSLLIYVFSSESVSAASVETVFIKKVLDSNDEIIIIDKDYDEYFLELGIGCSLSLWRYENKNVLVKKGGSFIDGISDKLILPNGKTCKIWDAEEIDNNYTDYFSKFSCPLNSFFSKKYQTCLCLSNYQISKDKKYCEKIPTCPNNSFYSSTNRRCLCQDGYKMNYQNTSCLMEKKNNQVYSSEIYQQENLESKLRSQYQNMISNRKKSQIKETSTIPDKTVINSKETIKNDFSEKINIPSLKNGNFCKTGSAPSINKNYCVKIPDNAHYVESKTDVWLCNEEYKEVGNTCIKNIQEKSSIEISFPTVSPYYTNEEIVAIAGSVPSGTESVRINDFVLTKFKTGDSTFIYHASKKFYTLNEGENNYEVIATDSNGKETSTQIKIIKE